MKHLSHIIVAAVAVAATTISAQPPEPGGPGAAGPGPSGMAAPMGPMGMPGGPGGGGAAGGPPGMTMGMGPMGMPGGGLGVMEQFYPPELIMVNQKAIGLKDEQASAIKAEMQKAMSKFTDLLWQQNAEEEKMTSIIKPERIDEKQATEQLDKLLGIENDMKRMRMSMLIKVKNALTPEQQTKLRELIKQSNPRQQSGSASSKGMMFPHGDGPMGKPGPGGSGMPGGVAPAGLPPSAP